MPRLSGIAATVATGSCAACSAAVTNRALTATTDTAPCRPASTAARGTWPIVGCIDHARLLLSSIKNPNIKNFGGANYDALKSQKLHLFCHFKDL